VLFPGELPITRSVFIQTERITGNMLSFRGLFSITRSVPDKTERQTGNFHGLKHKKARPKPGLKNKRQHEAAVNRCPAA
jgi:hypothetical protein